MEFTIIRDTDKEKVKRLVEKKKACDNFQTHINLEKAYEANFFKALRIIIKMKEISEEFDLGFAAFFIDQDGTKYFISNLINE